MNGLCACIARIIATSMMVSLVQNTVMGIGELKECVVVHTVPLKSKSFVNKHRLFNSFHNSLEISNQCNLMVPRPCSLITTFFLPINKKKGTTGMELTTKKFNLKPFFISLPK